MTEQPWEWHPDGPEAQAMLEQAQAEEAGSGIDDHDWVREEAAYRVGMGE